MSEASTKPVTLLIAAMGGEGGGVLMNWVVNAALRKGYPVQATSVPGVAQRTGATTYYVELIPEVVSDPAAPRPVFSLSPAIGEVDLMVSTELAEATRALSAGFITSDRTTLIGSIHRVFLTAERTAMGDGRLDDRKMLASLKKNTKQAIMFDARKASEEAGAVINAVMLGAIAATGILGIDEQDFIAGIEEERKAVKSNLAGFQAGLEIARKNVEPVFETPAKRADRQVNVEDLETTARANFPAEAHAVLGHGIRRLVDFQGIDYARLFLERLKPFAKADPELVREVARHLAVRMSYEDIIRVAQAKTRGERYQRIRGETSASDRDLVMVTEYFKPGFAEVCDLLPRGLARSILAWAERTGRLDRTYWGMHIRTSTVTGFAKVWFLAKLRWWRPRSYRWFVEQAAIQAWLDLVQEAADKNVGYALEVAELARLIKGYGSTHKRGVHNYHRIVNDLVRPALASGQLGEGDADRVRQAREAALADPNGQALDKALSAPPASPMPRAAE